LRETLPFFQQQPGTKITLLFPREFNRSFLSPPRKGVWNKCFLSHSSSAISFINLAKNDSQQFPYPEQIRFSVLFKTRELHMLSLFRKWSPNPLSFILFSVHEFPTFSCLPQQDFVGPKSPFHGQVRKFFQMGMLPISSLTLEEDFTTTSLSDNLLLWVRGLFWV
jgi:hypothetical protein